MLTARCLVLMRRALLPVSRLFWLTMVACACAVTFGADVDKDSQLSVDEEGDPSDAPEYSVAVRPAPSIERVIDTPDPDLKKKIFFSLTPAPGVEATFELTNKIDDSFPPLSLDNAHAEPAAAVDQDQPAALESFALLPDTYEESPADREDLNPLPPLDEELFNHGGSYLYCPEGDRLGWPYHCDSHYDYYRLPECWQKPEPLTAFAEFLGADPIKQYPFLKWCGPCGSSWEPRFVGYGDYQLFGFAFEQDDQRSDGLGHQLRVDLDLRLTGTERFHVQFRPLGRRNTGGSYYRFNDPSGYINNSTGEPDRYWFEGELYSIFQSYFNPFAVRDYNIVAGKFPYQLHNTLLINDEILGLILSKNTIYCGELSNLNIQAITGFNDVDTYPEQDTRIVGAHATADWRRVLLEGSYVFAAAEGDSRRDAHFTAFSFTKLIGLWTTAVRTLFKIGDNGGTGSGELYVLENNYARHWDSHPCGIESSVFYTNFFGATKGWNSIGGSNFDRLRTAFEVNPLVAISSGRVLNEDIWGASCGVQLFRHHEDESIIPEVAFQNVAGERVWGMGLRYLRKTGCRSFFEALGVANFSDDPTFRREGVFLSQTCLF